MYLIDFFKSVGRRSNIPQFIYLGINLLLICCIFALPMSDGGAGSIAIGALLGLGFYILSLAIALSPIGEYITRYQTGCKEIKDAQLQNYVMPLFNEVYQKARDLDSTIAPDVRLYVSDDDFKNAFATGRKTVCVTRGMVNSDSEEFKAVLAHEFGHLAHKDTDMLQVINVGNLIISAIIIAMRVCIIVGDVFMHIIGSVIGGDEGAFTMMMSRLSKFLSLIFIAGLTKLWTWLGVVLCMKSSRGNEFEADAFSTQLGYGRALIRFFNENVDNNPTGLFATLASSHPDKDDRIVNIIQVFEAIGGLEMEQQNGQLAEPQAAAVAEPEFKIQPLKPRGSSSETPFGGQAPTPTVETPKTAEEQVPVAAARPSTILTPSRGGFGASWDTPKPAAAFTDKYSSKKNDK